MIFQRVTRYKTLEVVFTSGMHPHQAPLPRLKSNDSRHDAQGHLMADVPRATNEEVGVGKVRHVLVIEDSRGNIHIRHVFTSGALPCLKHSKSRHDDAQGHQMVDVPRAKNEEVGVGKV